MVEQKFPDGNDRTPNDPCVLLSTASVVRLFEANLGAGKDGSPEYTNADVLRYIKLAAKKYNWDAVEIIHGQVLLRKNLPFEFDKPSNPVEPNLFVVRVTVESNHNAAGKTTVLAVIEKALRQHGFSDVVYDPEESEKSRREKYMLPVSAHPVLGNLRIELVEKHKSNRGDGLTGDSNLIPSSLIV